MKQAKFFFLLKVIPQAKNVNFVQVRGCTLDFNELTCTRDRRRV